MFGTNEYVLLSSQPYKTLFLNHLLKVSNFVYPHFSLLLPYELIDSTNKRKSIIHLYSYERRVVCHLLKFGSVSDVTKKLLCCPADELAFHLADGKFFSCHDGIQT